MRSVVIISIKILNIFYKNKKYDYEGLLHITFLDRVTAEKYELRDKISPASDVHK